MLPLLVAFVFAVVAPATASAADRWVRLTLNASDAACTWFDQLDCSYLEARNGHAPAPDPTDPDAVAPTFLNLANLSEPIVIDAVFSDDGTVRVPEGNVDWPSFMTTLDNALVGTVTVRINFSQTDEWTGTFDEGTGEMNLTAPFELSFSLNCDPASPTLCGAVFPGTGNMGTWVVRSASGPVELTTGHMDAADPPVDYGPEWVGPVAEDGAPFDPGTGELTLINNNQVLHFIDPATDCIDDTSVACTNPAIGGLVSAPLNDAIGATATEDTVPGAIDIRMTFGLSEPDPVETGPPEVDFGEQLTGTTSGSRNVEITATVEDVQIDGLFNEGGDDSDFFIANNRCGAVVEAGTTCELSVRFSPSNTGPRATDLMARIINPITGDPETVRVTTLKGTGVAEPPPPPPPPPPPKGIPPEVQAKLFAAIPRNGTAVVAKVICPEGTCTLGKQRAKFRSGGRAFAARLEGPSEIAEGKREKLRVVLSKRARRKLRKEGKGRIKVKLRVDSTNGTKIHPRFSVKTRPKANS